MCFVQFVVHTSNKCMTSISNVCVKLATSLRHFHVCSENSMASKKCSFNCLDAPYMKILYIYSFTPNLGVSHPVVVPARVLPAQPI